MNEAPEQSGHARVQHVPAAESPWSLLFGAVAFGYAGFLLAWSTHPAAQTAMWSLRFLSIAFASTFIVALIAPRIGVWVQWIVMGLAAVLLCGSGAWILVVNGGKDPFGWLMIVMGLFDAAEVWRWVARRRLVQRRASAAYGNDGGP